MKTMKTKQAASDLEQTLSIALNHQERGKKLAKAIHELIKAEVQEEALRIDRRIDGFYAGYPGYD